MARDRARLSPPLEVAAWVSGILAALMAVVHLTGKNSPTLRGAVFFCVCGLIACGIVGVVRDLPLARPRCPRCARRGLRQVRRHPRFHHCSSCRQRCQRGEFGDWVDASGPKYDAIYRPRTDAWLGAAPPVADETTCGSLLGRKRRRERSLLIALMGRRRPWPEPPAPPPKEGFASDPDRSVHGTLLRKKRLRDHARGLGPAPGQARPLPTPLWDPTLDGPPDRPGRPRSPAT